MLKRIGTTARIEMEKMGDRSIFLELRVKVAKAGGMIRISCADWVLILRNGDEAFPD